MILHPAPTLLGMAALLLAALALPVHGQEAPPPVPAAVPADAAPGEWHHYGNTLKGQRYSPLDQIRPANVARLQVAWTFRTGEIRGPGDPPEFNFEATPLKIRDTLYFCSPKNVVYALDPETGAQKWKHDPQVRYGSNKSLTCRAVSYHEATDESGFCARRILEATVDARLIALDADSGQPCPGFGNGGTVDLKQNMGEVKPGYYYVTSAPLIVRNLAVVGGWVVDNQSVDEPSGVIRAFDVTTGELVWNWDSGRPDDTAPLRPGERYTRTSPNSWGPASADEALGLIYLPMGNQTPDTWGGKRYPQGEPYSSAIVALDAATGQLRWVYQTVHHDIWDLDIGAQPTLVDIQTPDGVKPAVLAVTKRGDIFVLDRRNGQPIVPAPEKPVPSEGAAPGDWVSPTQPFSQLSFAPRTLTEKDMWGATPLDQLWCRIQFKRYRYEGIFTPQTPEGIGILAYPGNYGVFDWGGVAVDEERQIMIVNPNYMAFRSHLVSREQVPPAHETVQGEGAEHAVNPEGHGPAPQHGAPFAVDLGPFLSPFGVPCQAPPWGYVAAVDLKTNSVLWQHKVGTTRDVAPLGIPLPVGVPALAGPIVTKGGLAFHSGTLDNYIRAFRIDNGEKVWEARLPAGGQATPMSYMSEKSGRQFVLVSAGGHGGLGTTPGDYVIAFALPREAR